MTLYVRTSMYNVTYIQTYESDYSYKASTGSENYISSGGLCFF